jgi:hypothetical protein
MDKDRDPANLKSPRERTPQFPSPRIDRAAFGHCVPETVEPTKSENITGDLAALGAVLRARKAFFGADFFLSEGGRASVS